MKHQFRIAIPLLIVAAIVASPTDAGSAERTGRISGVVRDADTGQPVPYANAVVVQGPRVSMTSLDGTFVIEDVKPGKVTFRAEAPRYTPMTLNDVAVFADSVTIVDVSILRAWPVPKILIERNEGPAADAARADPTRPFEVDVPRGWFASAANYSVMHYRDVIAVVNNRSRELRVTDKRVANGWVNDLDSVAEQLEPGTIYVDLAHFEGPGGSARYGPGREESFAQERASFLKEPTPKHSNAELDGYALTFFKWGSRWDVQVYCRKPYSNRDRDRAFQMLRGMRFLERPIVNSAQAVGRAVDFLPAEARIPMGADVDCAIDGWLAYGGQNGKHVTRIDKTDEGFEVTFVLLEEDPTKKGNGEWRYLVRWDGSVEGR
jgi:hypothetical protein